MGRVKADRKYARVPAPRAGLAQSTIRPRETIGPSTRIALLVPAWISKLGAGASLWSPREDQAVGLVLPHLPCTRLKVRIQTLTYGRRSCVIMNRSCAHEVLPVLADFNNLTFA